jgi:ATP-dependent exoDNAse (exonuclease V) alpha subunit
VVALNTRLQQLLNPASPLKGEITVSRPIEIQDDQKGVNRDNAGSEIAEKQEKVRKEILRVGDRVIQTRNDTSRGLVNGDIGIITQVSAQAQTIWVNFNGDPQIIDREQLKEVRLAYSMTVHKSQGSEAKFVIIPLPSDHENMLTRNLLYTAVTRAKAQVLIIGDEKAIRLCLTQTIDSNPNLVRNSTLAKHCRDVVLELEADTDPYPS